MLIIKKNIEANQRNFTNILAILIFISIMNKQQETVRKLLILYA